MLLYACSAGATGLLFWPMAVFASAITTQNPETAMRSLLWVLLCGSGSFKT